MAGLVIINGHKKISFRKIEGATTDLISPTKSSRRRASIGVGTHFIFSVFEKIILKIDEKCSNTIVSPHQRMLLVESSSTEVSGASEMPRLDGNLFFREPSCCVSTQKMCQPMTIGILSTSKNSGGQFRGIVVTWLDASTHGVAIVLVAATAIPVDHRDDCDMEINQYDSFRRNLVGAFKSRRRFDCVDGGVHLDDVIGHLIGGRACESMEGIVGF